MKCENCEHTIPEQDPVVCCECLNLQPSLEDVTVLNKRIEELERDATENDARIAHLEEELADARLAEYKASRRIAELEAKLVAAESRKE